jgi:hypothetical protein
LIDDPFDPFFSVPPVHCSVSVSAHVSILVRRINSMTQVNCRAKITALGAGLLCSLLVLMAGGCGAEQGRGIVRGKVLAPNPKKNGKMEPVVWGTVTFWSKSKQEPICADIEPDGTYVARGVYEGENQVLVSSPDPKDEGTAGQNDGPEDTTMVAVRKKWFPISNRYELLDATDVPPVTIQSGEQQFDIQLKKSWHPGEGQENEDD